MSEQLILIQRYNHPTFKYQNKKSSDEIFLEYFAKKLSWHSCDDEWKFVTNCLKIAPKKSA